MSKLTNSFVKMLFWNEKLMHGKLKWYKLKNCFLEKHGELECFCIKKKFHSMFVFGFQEALRKEQILRKKAEVIQIYLSSLGKSGNKVCGGLCTRFTTQI